MNMFWLKIAGAAIVVVLVFLLVTMFTSNGTPEPDESEQTPGNFYEQVQKDKENFSELPEPSDSQEQSQSTVNQTAPEKIQPVPEPPKPAEPVVLYFKPIGEIEEIEAERLLNAAVPGRSIGRLPMTGFKMMVDTCRQIIKRWPDSKYAYNAKRMLADMPERYQQRYNVTQEEKDVSIYAEPREGTQSYTIKETR